MLAPEAPPGMAATYQHLDDARMSLPSIFEGKDGPRLPRPIHDGSARDIEASLGATLAEGDSAIQVDVLANYLAGARIGLARWWLEPRHPHTRNARTDVPLLAARQRVMRSG